MREIIFRAYQKNFKRMLPVASIEYHNNEIEVVTVDNRGANGKYDVIPHYSTYTAGDEEFPLSSLVLMQYTGLKDKKGTRIFEGDVCAHSDKENYPRPLTVEWIDKFACFAFVDKGDFYEKYYFVREDMQDLEVIGNIHETEILGY